MTPDQVDKIVELINAKLNQARECLDTLDGLCDVDYLKGRNKYPLTALVYSAFDVDTQDVPGFLIQKVPYGGINKLNLPELSNKEMLIDVYNDGSRPWTTDVVKEKLKLEGSRLHLLIFSVDKATYTLTKLRLFSLDGFDDNDDARVVNRETLYDAKLGRLQVDGVDLS